MSTAIRRRRYKYRRKVFLNPLQQICGYWKSAYNSPPVRIFRSGQGYRITFEYLFGTSITVSIKRTSEHVEFDLFGRIELDYDQERDMLLIATEGEYYRVFTSE